MTSFWNELKKRNVIKVGIAYAVVAWLLVQIVVAIEAPLRLPSWTDTFVIVCLAIGAPVALCLAWAYELNPHRAARAEPDGAEPAATNVSRRRLLLSGTASLGLLGVGIGTGAYVQTRLRPSIAPVYQRVTFRRGMIRTARFTPDGTTVLYGALWDGDDCRVYAVRPTTPESAPLDLPRATPLAISPDGEVAVALGRHYRGVMTYGTLARVPLTGSAPRELVENVKYADWSPDGTELAIVRRVGDRDRLEYPIGNVLAESPLSGFGQTGGFSFPRISRDGERVACFELTTGLRGTVVMADRRGGKRSLTPEYLNVFGLAWNGDEVWFTAAEERPLLRDAIMAVGFDGRPRRVMRLIANASLHDVSPDGRLLIAHTDDREGIAVRTPDDVAERDLAWLDSPQAADISADGQMILFTETGVGGGPNSSIYLRRTDGAPAVRLGDGYARALSPDACWALGTPELGSGRLHLLPTGAGEARRIERPAFSFSRARWLPDGMRVVVEAREGDRPARLYVLDLESGALAAITSEHIEPVRWAVSPDGRLAAAQSSSGRMTLHPVAGGDALDAPAPADEERLVGWIEAGLLVANDPTGMDLGRIFTMDPSSGQRALWREIRPRDPAGLMWHGGAFIVTPDGSAYAYSWHRALSDLYVLSGVA